MNRFSTRNISWAALFLSMLVLVTGNLNSASSQSSVISGCANMKTGALRISSKCAKSEKPITWNIQGPQGIQGLQGPEGIQGLQGNAGSVTSYSSSIVRRVYDFNNQIVGELYGAFGTGMTVKVGESLVTYNSSGQINSTGEVAYLNSNCTGLKYAVADFENQYSTLYPFIYIREGYRNTEGVKIYNPYETLSFVARGTGPLLNPTNIYYASFSSPGEWRCEILTSRPNSPLYIQPLQTFAPQFSFSIATPFSIR